jgi:hypothetical protein
LLMLGVLLGRERELAEIGRVIDAAREGSGGRGVDPVRSLTLA